MDFASGMAAFEAKHFSRAMQMLSPFASQGDKVAQHLCAIMYQNGLGTVRNDAKAFALMKASAEQGYGLAQHGIGFMYLEGECAEKNGEEAAKWFRQAGAQGLQGSLTTLALMYKLAGFTDLG
jgi:TPR repeat protein